MSNDEVTIINDNVLTEVISVNIVEEEIIQVNPIEDSLILVEATESEPVTVIDDLKEIPVFTGVQGIPVEQKGIPGGVATLNNEGKIPLDQIPDSNLDLEQFEEDIRLWISEAVDGKIDIDELNLRIQNAVQDKIEISDLNDYVLKNDISDIVTSEEVSTMIKDALLPIDDSLQNINSQLEGIDVLLSEILGE